MSHRYTVGAEADKEPLPSISSMFAEPTAFPIFDSGLCTTAVSAFFDYISFIFVYMDAVNEDGLFSCDAVIPEAFYYPFAVFGQGVLFHPRVPSATWTW